MNGKFILSSEIEREQLDWGEMGWVSHPPSTESKILTVMEVTLGPGGGHNFHKHPDQEEVISVVSGEIEQWLETEKMTLKPGDSIFIKPNIIHASFNISSQPAKLMVALGPCVGATGYEVVDVSSEAPWNSLR
ncbi:MAG: cupin domain-containing protein [Anaerolineae bacterium]